ncbi:MAG: hypothetical protein CO108_02705 [Deltaproteobacteria bacterium CG_4_9_14_3_um_filter_63_12]|nr:MAG: hypothetical protein CO108_02705 [Deltaproteobacteria bacterium CG_4_9_14_3_um_filter_63_12]
MPSRVLPFFVLLAALGLFAGSCDDEKTKGAPLDTGAEVDQTDETSPPGDVDETSQPGDVEEVSADPCSPNPCASPHQSVCTAVGEVFQCACDAGFLFEGGLCVPGATCDGMLCPDDGACVLQAGAAQCECDTGYHLDGELCCALHASASAGSCLCDLGYSEVSGACEADPGNPCLAEPCAAEISHRNTCVVDDTSQGYHCDCNTGYHDNQGSCTLEVVSACATGLVCRAGYCVAPGSTNEQCLADFDCHTLNPDAPTLCNAAAAGGICMSCGQDLDCPGSAVCNEFSTCATPCSSNSDCPYGTCYRTQGLCGQRFCNSDADCFSGTVCIDENGDGSGLCMRVPCVETQCSPYLPNGTCEAGATCLGGACVTSCTPNPCSELNKGQCVVGSSGVLCLCDTGFELDTSGNCVPSAGSCPTGFTCEAGVCVDRGDVGFNCALDGDCGSGLTCSSVLPSGTCSGCGVCPTGQTCLAGYCLRPCVDASDCAGDMVCRNHYCGRKDCASGADCGTGATCVLNSQGAGTCNRLPCL